MKINLSQALSMCQALYWEGHIVVFKILSRITWWRACHLHIYYRWGWTRWSQMVLRIESVIWRWVPILTFSNALAFPQFLPCFFFPHLTAVWTFELAPTTGFPHNSDGEESAYNAGDPDSIPGLGRSPGEGNGNPLQYSCLGNPMDRGAWRATVHGVARVGYDLATEPPNHHHRLLSIRVICVLCPDCLMGWVLERRHWFSGLKTMLGTLQAVMFADLTDQHACHSYTL